MSLYQMSMELVVKDETEAIVQDDLKEHKECMEEYQESMVYWYKTMNDIYSMYPDTR